MNLYVLVLSNNVWYEYSNYKWNEIDSGNTLKIVLISKRCMISI